MAREGQWSEAIAVGNLNFVEKVKSELGSKTAHREVIEEGGTCALREQSEACGSDFTGKNEVLSSENTRIWNEDSEFYGNLAWSDPRPSRFLGQRSSPR
jgi:putative transposase